MMYFPADGTPKVCCQVHGIGKAHLVPGILQGGAGIDWY